MKTAVHIHEAALVEGAGSRGQIIGAACWLGSGALLILFVLHFLI